MHEFILEEREWVCICVHSNQVNLEILTLEEVPLTLVQMGIHQIHETSSKYVQMGALWPSQTITSHFTCVQGVNKVMQEVDKSS